MTSEIPVVTQCVDINSQQSNVCIKQSQREFNDPLKPEVFEQMKYKNFSPETNKKIKWATKIYREWRSYRNGCADLKSIDCDLDVKSSITQDNLTFALSRFITEVKKVDGKDFQGNTLYDILICIQFHLESIGLFWKLLNDQMFSDVKYTLDNMMKLQTAKGIGVSVKKAEILSKI